MTAGADFLDALRGCGLLWPEELRRAQAVADESGMPLEKAVVALGLLAEDQVLWFAAGRAGVSLVFPTEDGVDLDLVARFPADMLLKFDALPLLEDADGTVVVAFTAPPAPETVEKLAEASGKPVRPALASGPRLRRVLGRLLDPKSADAGRASAHDPSGVTAFYRHLTTAFGGGADELRFEPGPADVRVRRRLGGRLSEMGREPAALGPAIAARARMFAGIAPGASAGVRHAATRAAFGGRPTRLALSIVPTRHGECVVLRAVAPVEIPTRLCDWPLPSDLREWLGGPSDQPASPSRAARRAVIVRGDDDEVKVALLRSIATQADESGLAVLWIGPRGSVPSGCWIVVDDGDAAGAIADARPDVVVVDGAGPFPTTLLHGLDDARRPRADAPAPAAGSAVVDVRVERRGNAAQGTIVVESRIGADPVRLGGTC